MVHADAAALPDYVKTKAQLYAHLYDSLESLLGGQRSWVSNLANASSVIYASLNRFEAWAGKKPVNWAGFYLLSPFINGLSSVAAQPVKRPTLLLGPFHGLPACQAIASVPGRGVCADASALLPPRTVVVPSTEAYPGHIACDSASQSEIVVPLVLPRSRLPPSFDASKPEWSGRGDGDVIIGVLDIDCEELDGFDDEDRKGLERIAQLIVTSCDW